MNKENKKKVVYTCLTGDYDNLVRLSYLDKEWDYVCFTDNQTLLQGKGRAVWDIRPLLFNGLDNSKNNRWHKINVLDIFPQYEESIYIDANVNFLTSYFFDTVKSRNQDILVPLHNARDCIYDELEAVIAKNKDSEKICREQIEYIRSRGFPPHYGLSENGVMYRKHASPAVRKIMPEWWQIVEKYSTRDQLSFAYVLWNNGIRIQDITISAFRYDYTNFDLELHRDRLNQKIYFQRRLRNGKRIVYVMGKRMFIY